MEIRRIHNGFVVKIPSVTGPLVYYPGGHGYNEYFCKDVDEVCEHVRTCLENKWPPEEPKAV